MTTWGRRIRGAIKMGFTWAVVGIAAGALLARIPGFNSDLPFAILFAPLGFAVGVIFSGILVVSASRQGLGRLSLSRFAGWGAASGALLAGIFGAAAALRGASVLSELLLFGPALTAAGAFCAAGSLALARRAERRELRGTAESANAELSADEAHPRLERGG